MPLTLIPTGSQLDSVDGERLGHLFNCSDGYGR
jgi:hypothetical protein